ncbi:hypothetical protein, partial [Vallitalea longa]|uniref:hypothetical protein n=1 Tax=Vallitalea longa TaxID=2936439 RepID=UPI00248F6139
LWLIFYRLSSLSINLLRNFLGKTFTKFLVVSLFSFQGSLLLLLLLLFSPAKRIISFIKHKVKALFDIF